MVTMRRLPWQQTRNPSGRRGGIAIQFSCEGCGHVHELTVTQHKGNSFLGPAEALNVLKEAEEAEDEEG